MARRKQQPICEIIFGQLRIPVLEKEQGKKVIEGIFMIGETGKGETKTRGRKRGGRKAARVKAEGKVKRAVKIKRMTIKRVARKRGKGRKPAGIEKSPEIGPVSVG